MPGWSRSDSFGSDFLSPCLRVQLEGLPALVQAVLSNDPNVQLEATTQFRKLLSIGEIRILCVAVAFLDYEFYSR